MFLNSLDNAEFGITIGVIATFFAVLVGFAYNKYKSIRRKNWPDPDALFAIIVVVALLFFVNIVRNRFSTKPPTGPVTVTSTPTSTWITPSPTTQPKTPTPSPQQRTSTLSTTPRPTAPQMSTLFRVVNCKEYINLRPIADANYTRNLKRLSLGNTVEYLSTAENGFYFVNSGNEQGYVLAVYLAPQNSNTNTNFLPATKDTKFNSSDLIVNGITINHDGMNDVRNRLGDPIETSEEKGKIKWTYQNLSVEFAKNTSIVKGIKVYAKGVEIPRKISVGMHISEALGTFPMYSSSILLNSGTHNLILYSDAEQKLSGSYGEVQNSSSMHGNGKIVFKSGTSDFMEIEIVNSYVTSYYVYTNSM